MEEDCDITLGGAKVRLNQSECICNQPTATGDTEDTHADPPHPPIPGNNPFSASPAPSLIYPAPFRADHAHFRADPATIKEAAGDDFSLSNPVSMSLSLSLTLSIVSLPNLSL
ncbi:unnamed protein product [Arctogadus glacialis]